MEQRALGRSGLVVSRLGLGTMTWGQDTGEDEAAEQLTTFVDAGGTLVDTADVYTDGESERILGRPLEETLAACDAAVASGRTRYVDVSNFTGWQTAQAATWQRAWPGRTPLVSTQMEYSLLQRGIEREVVPAAEALGLGVLPWSPLGRGLLTGKYRHSTPADSRGASSRWGGFIDSLRSATADRVVEAVCTAADGLGRTPLAVALAWVRDRPGVVAPIVGARIEQLQASLDAEDVRLPPAICTALNDVSLPPAGYPEHRPET